MHCHENLQLIYVLKGTIEVKTLNDMVKITAGSGIFKVLQKI